MQLILLGVSALVVSGCASTWPSDARYVEVIDHQKIQLVENWARSSNTQVIWITAPTRKVPAAGT
jgi:hypothetical protein